MVESHESEKVRQTTISGLPVDSAPRCTLDSGWLAGLFFLASMASFFLSLLRKGELNWRYWVSERIKMVVSTSSLAHGKVYVRDEGSL